MYETLRRNAALLIDLSGQDDYQLAAVFKTDRSTINRWRRGKMTPRNPEIFARRLGVPPEVLVFGSEDDVRRHYRGARPQPVGAPDAA